MYEKNLTEDFRLRLSKRDMDYLKSVATERNVSVSEVVRSIIGEYRRSCESLQILKGALAKMNDIEVQLKNNEEEGDMMSNGDTNSNFND